MSRPLPAMCRYCHERTGPRRQAMDSIGSWLLRVGILRSFGWKLRYNAAVCETCTAKRTASSR